MTDVPSGASEGVVGGSATGANPPSDLSALRAPQEGDTYVDAFLPTGMFGGIVVLCLRCGALVGNRALHDDAHDKDSDR